MELLLLEILKDTLVHYLTARFGVHHAQASEALRTCATTASTLEALYAFANHSSTTLTPYIELCLWQLSLGIELPPALIDALEHGCNRVAREEPR